jgi:PAS domain S-box-containing protein
MRASSSSQSSNARSTIGLLIATLEEPRENEVWAGVVDAAREQEMNLISLAAGPYSMVDTPSFQRRILCDLINPKLLDGLITFQWWRDRQVFERSCQRYRPLPIVTIMRLYEGYAGVAEDSYTGMRAQLRHLIEVHGYRRIAYIRDRQGIFGPQERYRAYRESLAEYGIPFRAELVTPFLESTHRDRGVEMMQRLLDERYLKMGQDVEVIVTGSDELALGALDVLQERGIRVPEDVALVGLGNLAETRLTAPPLTTLAVPWYELGWKAVEVLCAQIAGEGEPAHVVVPLRQVVRRSCGCLEPVVVQAATGIKKQTQDSLERLITSHKTMLLHELELVIGTTRTETADWTERILDAFVCEVTEKCPAPAASQQFLSVLEEMLYQMEQSGNVLEIGQTVLSILHRHLAACYLDDEAVCRADNLWQQARVLVGTIGQWAQMRWQSDAERQAAMLRELSQHLISTFDLARVTDVLAAGLPSLDIPSCYLSLYEHPESPAAGARLIMAYNEYGRVVLRSKGRSFPSNQLIPDGILLRDHPYSLIVEPLFFDDEQIGIMLFEIGSRDGKMYEILRGAISSALQGALLVQRIREHAAEITRQHAEIARHHAEITRQKYVLDTFMATVPDRIYFKDLEGRITRANMAHARRLGFSSPEEEVGKTDFDVLPEAQARIRFEQEQKVLHTENPLINLEEQTVWSDGRVDWSLVTKMPLRNEHGELIGTFGISRDISQLKQAEHELVQYRNHLEELVAERTAELTQTNVRLQHEIEERTRVERALRISEEQYRLLAENVVDGIVIVQHGTVVFTNKAFATMVGYPVAQIVRTDLMRFFHDRSREFAQDRFGDNGNRVDDGNRTVGAHRVSESGWEAELVTSDGRTIWAEIAQNMIVWDSTSTILLTIRDITGRKLREQQLEEERIRLEQENLAFQSALTQHYKFEKIVGKNLAMQKVYKRITDAAVADANVLIVGESGTGKELIAQTIHQLSLRKTQELVAVNCAALQEPLFESAFFGHLKGSFTGANRDKAGFFDRAHRGILFLDEVTELTPGMQAKLLRVLQDGRYFTVGSTTAKQADVVIVAATNKDVRMEIGHKRLREDFFYRICMVEIEVPPLRNRKDDLPLLIEHILEQYRQKQARLPGRKHHHLPADATELPGELVQALYTYSWPGNVRELQSVLQRYLISYDLNEVLTLLGTTSRALSPSKKDPAMRSLPDAVNAFEKQMIAETLAQTDYRVIKTAEKLGVSRRTLHNKLKKYRITLKRMAQEI